MCDTPIARITGCVSSLRIEVGDSPENYSVDCTRVNKVVIINLWGETIMGEIRPLWLGAIWVMPDLAREVSTQQIDVTLPLRSSFEVRRADENKMPREQ